MGIYVYLKGKKRRDLSKLPLPSFLSLRDIGSGLGEAVYDPEIKCIRTPYKWDEYHSTGVFEQERITKLHDWQEKNNLVAVSAVSEETRREKIQKKRVKNWHSNKIRCVAGYTRKEIYEDDPCLSTDENGEQKECPHAVGSPDWNGTSHCHAGCTSCDNGEYFTTEEGEFCEFCGTLSTEI